MKFYPKIHHVPWSKGIGQSKLISKSMLHLQKCEIALIFIDNLERFTYNNGNIWKGTHSINPHYISNIESLINNIPNTFTIYGTVIENIYLPHFMVNKKGIVLSIEYTNFWCDVLKVKVPYDVDHILNIEECLFNSDKWNKSCIMRNCSEFSILNFNKNVVKYVINEINETNDE